MSTPIRSVERWSASASSITPPIPPAGDVVILSSGEVETDGGNIQLEGAVEVVPAPPGPVEVRVYPLIDGAPVATEEGSDHVRAFLRTTWIDGITLVVIGTKKAVPAGKHIFGVQVYNAGGSDIALRVRTFSVVEHLVP